MMEDAIKGVIREQHTAAQRGALSMWTIYDRPKDYPDGYVARRHEASKGGTVATADTLVGDLAKLRAIFQRAGLFCITRSEEDDPVIVETWT
jgi:hypothetical protein